MERLRLQAQAAAEKQQQVFYTSDTLMFAAAADPDYHHGFEKSKITTNLERPVFGWC